VAVHGPDVTGSLLSILHRGERDFSNPRAEGTLAPSALTSPSTLARIECVVERRVDQIEHAARVGDADADTLFEAVDR